MQGVADTNISDPYKCLALAIVENAVYDYRDALRRRRSELHLDGRVKKSTEENLAEIEDFFQSEWFELLCPYDGLTLMHACRNGRYPSE